MPMVYFFAIRRNIFEVSILRHQRQLILKHLGKSLSVMESKVSLDEIEPVTRLSKHLRLIVRHPETGALDTLYLNRSGKYLNRDLLEQISKGYLSKTASQEVDETATNIAATARKYAIRPKRLIKDAAESAEDKPNPTV